MRVGNGGIWTQFPQPSATAATLWIEPRLKFQSSEQTRTRGAVPVRRRGRDARIDRVSAVRNSRRFHAEPWGPQRVLVSRLQPDCAA